MSRLAWMSPLACMSPLAWKRSAVALGTVAVLAGAIAGRAQSSGEGRLTNPVAALPLDRLSATKERPLFSPTRRPRAPDPAPVAAVAPPPPPPPPPTVVLYGIISDDDDAQAVVQVGGNQRMRLRLGDQIAGWKVSIIEPRRLVLTLGDRTTSFTLFSGQGARGPAAGLAFAQRRSERLNRQGQVVQPVDNPPNDPDPDDLPSR